MTSMIGISQISAQILKELGSDKAFRQTFAALVRTVNDLSQRLEEWRKSVPAFLEIGTPLNVSRLPPEVKIVHASYIQFAYYNNLISIHMIFALPWTSKMFGTDRDPAFRNQVARSTKATAEAARNIILTTKYIEPHGASPAW